MAGSSVAQLKAEKISSRTTEFSAKEKISETVTPELVIALCGPLGTPLHRVADILRTLLEKHFEYDDVETIRLSQYIRDYGNPTDPESIQDLINAGNDLREKHGASILAQLAIKRIAGSRGALRTDGKREEPLSLLAGSMDTSQIEPAPVVRHCHIIDSIKNREELNLLRAVYGDILHVVGVHTPLSLRVERLEGKCGTKANVFDLIDRDSGEERDTGQSVREVFPRADFFIRVDGGTDDQLQMSLHRYLNLLLGAKVITPTIHERAMYAAYYAARNSACLSRQVGASLADEAGDLIAVGWNDVPRAFGGLYESHARPQEGEYVDHRCWNKDGGKCFNDEEKDEIAKRLTSALILEGIISEDNKEEVSKRLRRSSELRGLIEFSRAVHAEMHALLNAGKSAGQRVQGGRLYVTTYPCHACARHIIAAGVREVRFIEPYRKSLATRLHSDAITESESDASKVRILPFDGVAPSRYLSLFSEWPDGRKDAAGKMKTRSDTKPVTAVTLEAITTLEGLAVRELQSKGLIGQD